MAFRQVAPNCPLAVRASISLPAQRPVALALLYTFPIVRKEEATMTRIPAVGEALRSSPSGTLRQEARGARAPVCPTASTSGFYGTMSAAATLPRPLPTTRWQASLHHAPIPRSLHSSAIVRAQAPPTPASSTETPDIVPLSQQEYSQLTDRVFDSLVGQLETMLDEMDDQSWEVEYSVSELV